MKDVPRSIEFYTQLGFTVAKTFAADGEPGPTWASLESGRAELMIGRGDRAEPSVLFYIFCDDVAAEHSRASDGVRVGDIQYPFYAPRGEFAVEDPDGYILMISHT